MKAIVFYLAAVNHTEAFRRTMNIKTTPPASTTSKKEKFLTLLSNLMLKFRNENSDFIESIPANDRRTQSSSYADLVEEGFTIRFPFYENDAQLKDKCKAKVSEMGRELVTTLLTELKGEITIDLKGHNRSSGIYPLKVSDDFLSIEKIARNIGFKVGINIIVMPTKISENFDKERLVSSIYDIFSLEHEDCVQLVRETWNNCTCCGDEIEPLFNINTLQISLYSTPDLKSNSLTAMIEPKECKYPNGVNSYSKEIKTPSKKLVIANDLREVLAECSVDVDDYISAKFGDYHTIAMSQLANVYNTEFYVEHHNAMYIQVGSGSTSIFQDKETLMVEAKPEYKCDPDDNHKDEYNGKENEVHLGDIDLALWALCAMDFDQFVKLCLAKDKDTSIENWIDDLGAVVIDVKSETTKFTSHYFAPEQENEIRATIG